MPLNTFARRVAALEESQDRRMSAGRALSAITALSPRWRRQELSTEERATLYAAFKSRYGTAANMLKLYQAAHGGNEE